MPPNFDALYYLAFAALGAFIGIVLSCVVFVMGMIWPVFAPWTIAPPIIGFFGGLLFAKTIE